MHIFELLCDHSGFRVKYNGPEKKFLGENKLGHQEVSEVIFNAIFVVEPLYYVS